MPKRTPVRPPLDKGYAVHTGECGAIDVLSKGYAVHQRYPLRRTAIG